MKLKFAFGRTARDPSVRSGKYDHAEKRTSSNPGVRRIHGHAPISTTEDRVGKANQIIIEAQPASGFEAGPSIGRRAIKKLAAFAGLIGG
jgi:hypothetical protein